MKKCKKCNIYVDTNRKTCPLCYDVLKQVDEEDIKHSPYPKPIVRIYKRNIFLRIISFLSTLGIVTSIIINIITFKETPKLWSLIVILGFGYIWVLIKSTFKNKGNIPMRLVVQMLAVSTITYVIDRVSGYSGWSLDYVIPFLSMASLLSIISMLFGNFVKYGDYLLYLLASVILGFIPFLLWLFNVVTALWPSLSAASLSFATIVGMLIFADQETKEEIKKRFHI